MIEIYAGVLKKRPFLKFFLVAVVALTLAACSGNEEKEKSTGVDDTQGQQQAERVEVVHEPQLLSVLPQEAALLLQKEKDTLVVDVRTQQEIQQVRIPGSVPVSLMDIMQGREDLPKNKPILLVCAVGGRSYAAGLYMLKNGYSRLYNLRGGIVAWEKNGMSVEAGVK